MNSADERPVIGITLGDAAGIGPEVGAAALASGQLDQACAYRHIGKLPLDAVPGQPTAGTARAAWDALEEAARLALAGELAAVVTGPVCKANLYAEGFHYPGQTEFFAARCGVDNFAMMLTGGKLTVALVSTHLPLGDAIRQLSTPEIVRVGGLLANFLTRRNQRSVRVAVAGLNPHAGENGTLGREEIDLIEPAVLELQRSHAGRAEFAGPVPPDTVFHQAANGQWDGVLCMYHDQGLIPLKLHAFDEGVNVTLGLPIIRTSPDHGTAFGLAGKGTAHAGSMIAAIRLAAELAKSRASAGATGSK
jgi:4-hydroxythreonine-4-phosphate dehydrogenase